jgi:putative radical SAM enzyme (TIGR03279 family)
MYTELFETLYPISALKKEKGAVVSGVDGFALGSELGLEVGDTILKVNRHNIRDFLDFQYYTGSEEFVTLEVLKRSGDLVELEVEIGEGEIWGLDFEYFTPRQCVNDCIFCFCNQNPAGSRESLFFKDEDTRLSFLHGNYTTMSSISKMELDRIVEQRLSPQYISVHATDPDVRRYLLGRKRADDILGKMRYLNEQGIALHAQIVLCPTINDGEVLKRTIQDLAELRPGLTSVAVVPVVFTKLHNYAHRMTAVTDEYARQMIEEMRPVQHEFRNRFGNTFVFLADEFYLRAGLPLPARSHYGDYPQIEDGVGMVRRFVMDAKKTLKKAAPDFIKRGKLYGTVATGELFFPVLSEFVQEMNDAWGTRLKVIAVGNKFFGEEITVAGLLTGGDLVAAQDSIEGNFLIVPEQSCLKSGHIFLDDLSLADLERKLNLPVAHGGASLISLVEQSNSLETRL